jgi:hypothetical protein
MLKYKLQKNSPSNISNVQIIGIETFLIQEILIFLKMP